MIKKSKMRQKRHPLPPIAPLLRRLKTNKLMASKKSENVVIDLWRSLRGGLSIFNKSSNEIKEDNVQDQGVIQAFKWNSNSHIQIVEKVMSSLGEKKGNAWQLYWAIGRIEDSILQKLKQFQKVNYFPKTSEITRKDNLCKNIASMQVRFPKDYDFIPPTFLLPNDSHLLMSFAEKNKFKAKLYICKPNGSSQGRGIFVTNRPDEVISFYMNR